MNKRFVFAVLFLMIVADPATATGDVAAGKVKSSVCAICHGIDGNSTNPEWPKIAGQHAGYVTKQLLNFMGEGEVRSNPTMAPIVATLSRQDVDDLAAYFASQTIKSGEADPKWVDLGEKLYRGGNATSGVPACMACHAPDGKGNPAAKFPALAGQHSKYVANQLRTFRAGERANDAGMMMRNIAAKMTDTEIDAVASYIQGLY